MRISTNTIYQSGVSKLVNLQAEQAKLQQQISTGQRIATPSEDPVAAARALEISHAQEINTQFADTRKTAELKLNTLESNLTNVTDLLVSVHSSLIAAGNAAYSDQERGFIATDLSNAYDALLNLANTKDSAGNYLYAGFQTDTQPFTGTATGATSPVDNNIQHLQVDTQRQMAVNVPGDSVFKANGSNDLFAQLKSLVTTLNTSPKPASFDADLAAGIASIQAGLDNVLNVRADIGSKLHEIDALNTAGTDRGLQYSKSLSDLQDLDYTTALSDLSKNQTIMEAAQKSFVATTKMSLFDFI